MKKILIHFQLVYGFNCGSGAAYITTEEKWNDGAWHFAEFSRSGLNFINVLRTAFTLVDPESAK